LEAIHFKTTHNLVVSYPKADLMSRAIACAIDILIMMVVSALLAYIFSSMTILMVIFIIPFISFYHLVFEMYYSGQSIGKKIMKLRVVALDGSSPPLKSIFIRWAFRMIDVLMSLGSLAILSIYSSDKGQRIGDLLAGTTVVKTNIADDYSIKSLVNTNKAKREIKYNNLTRYTDEDMLLVKKVISRYHTNPTNEHIDIVHLLARKFYKDLDISHSPNSNEVNFLKDVLEEYIIVTR
jgi:uncharacterized RDD family membrane protein YckC